MPKSSVLKFMYISFCTFFYRLCDKKIGWNMAGKRPYSTLKSVISKIKVLHLPPVSRHVRYAKADPTIWNGRTPTEERRNPRYGTAVRPPRKGGTTLAERWCKTAATAGTGITNVRRCGGNRAGRRQAFRGGCPTFSRFPKPAWPQRRHRDAGVCH